MGRSGAAPVQVFGQTGALLAARMEFGTGIQNSVRSRTALQLGSGVAHGGECILSRIGDLQPAMIGDDEGVVRIRGGVGGPETLGGFAALDGSELGRRRGVHDVRAATEIAEDRGVQFAVGVSGMAECAAAGCGSRHGAESWLDGGGIRALASLYEGKYRTDCDSGWSREFSGRPTAWQGGFI